MSNERLQKAASYYKSGDKTQATKLLSEIVRQEPDNSLAWYGLALCLDEISKKAYCLKRVLAIDPSNQKAHQLLARLDGLEIEPDNHESTPKKRVAVDNPPKAVKNSRRNGLFAVVALLFSLVIIVFGISAFLFFNIKSLEIFDSPEEKYSREIEPIIAKLDEWLQGPVANWDKVMNDTVEGEGVSNSSVFTLYILYQDYPNMTTKENEEKARMILITNLIPTAESIVSDGYDIQVSIGGLTPPDSIKIAHQQIYDCIKYEVDRSNAMIKFLTESDTVSAENLNEASCTLMPNALEKVRAFIQDNR